MAQPYRRSPEFIHQMSDGTIKQVNPFSGTEVWTVPGRGNRPLSVPPVSPQPLDPAKHEAHCAFCAKRYLETPPEKERVVKTGAGYEVRRWLQAEELFDTVAEFRRIPNLFEILSYDYWHANYGYELSPAVAKRKADYLDSDAGLKHILSVVDMKLRASGHTPQAVAGMSVEEKLAAASGFFGGGHDVIIARRHYVDGATDDSQVASSGTLTPDEHEQFVALTVDAMHRQYNGNRYARYVAVFQNWLRPAGASFDHLHKQMVAIDERGVQQELVTSLLRDNVNAFNDLAVNYALYRNLLIAENEHAVMFAGFGHRYPTVEIYSRSEHSDPWRLSPEELRSMSDLIHAAHAAIGPHVPCNEEWHSRPADVNLAMPWRVMLKWRVSTLAGFEGDTHIYVNTIDPFTVRKRVVDALKDLRDDGVVGPMLVGDEVRVGPNPLRYRLID